MFQSERFSEHLAIPSGTKASQDPFVVHCSRIVLFRVLVMLLNELVILVLILIILSSSAMCASSWSYAWSWSSCSPSWPPWLFINSINCPYSHSCNVHINGVIYVSWSIWTTISSDKLHKHSKYDPMLTFVIETECSEGVCGRDRM